MVSKRKDTLSESCLRSRILKTGGDPFGSHPFQFTHPHPRLTLAELAERAPDAVLLPDEPHPFGDAEVALFAAQPIPAATRGAIRLCDGKDLFWYGSRAVTALPRVRALVDSLRLEA